jgi:uncharacterized protein DUF4277
MMNARLVPAPQAMLTPGEAVAGMRLNGRGCAHRPVSWTPPFVASTPLELWWHDGVRAERCNRFTLGRTLDEASADGCDLRLHERALGVCAREGLDRRVNHLETTSFSRRGDDIPERDEQAMTITHGYSRDHRPDLQPVVLARMVSEDGGIPCVRRSGDGTPSDLEMFQTRAQAWLAAFQHAPHPRYLMADSKLYHEDHAPHRRHLGCITRIPHPMGSVAAVITQALAWDGWHRLDEHTRDPRLEWCHDGMAPRGLVVSSQAAEERAAATRNHARPRAREAIHTPLLHLQATRVATPEAAHEALTPWATGWTDHQVDSSHLSDQQRYARQGRPTPRLPVKAIDWLIQAHVRPAEAAIAPQQHRHACVVIGTTSGTNAWQDTEVIPADTRQSQVAGGFRFLNDPRVCVSSLFVKTPCRIQGLLLVMTLAFLVYAVAQRRLRQQAAHHQETVPNQRNHPTTTPT